MSIITPTLNIQPAVATAIQNCVFGVIQGRASSNPVRQHFAATALNNGGNTMQFAQTVVFAYALYLNLVRNRVDANSAVQQASHDACECMAAARAVADNLGARLDQASVAGMSTSYNKYNMAIQTLNQLLNGGASSLFGTMDYNTACSPINNPFGIAQPVQQQQFAPPMNNGYGSGLQQSFGSPVPSPSLGQSGAGFTFGSPAPVQNTLEELANASNKYFNSVSEPEPVVVSEEPSVVESIENMAAVDVSNLSEDEYRALLANWRPTDEYGYHIPLRRRGYSQFIEIRDGVTIVTERKNFMDEAAHTPFQFKPVTEEDLATVPDQETDVTMSGDPVIKVSLLTDNELLVEHTSAAAIVSATVNNQARFSKIKKDGMRVNAIARRVGVMRDITLNKLVRETITGSITSTSVFTELHSSFASTMKLVANNKTPDGISSYNQLKQLDTYFTRLINRYMKYNLSVDVHIESFADDAGDLVEYFNGKELFVAAAAIEKYMFAKYIDTFSLIDPASSNKILGLDDDTDLGDTRFFIQVFYVVSTKLSYSDLQLNNMSDGVGYLMQNEDGVGTIVSNLCKNTNCIDGLCPDKVIIRTRDGYTLEASISGLSEGTVVVRNL